MRCDPVRRQAGKLAWQCLDHPAVLGDVRLELVADIGQLLLQRLDCGALFIVELDAAAPVAVQRLLDVKTRGRVRTAEIDLRKAVIHRTGKPDLVAKLGQASRARQRRGALFRAVGRLVEAVELRSCHVADGAHVVARLQRPLDRVGAFLCLQRSKPAFQLFQHLTAGG